MYSMGLRFTILGIIFGLLVFSGDKAGASDRVVLNYDLLLGSMYDYEARYEGLSSRYSRGHSAEDFEPNNNIQEIIHDLEELSEKEFGPGFIKARPMFIVLPSREEISEHFREQEYDEENEDVNSSTRDTFLADAFVIYRSLVKADKGKTISYFFRYSLVQGENQNNWGQLANLIISGAIDQKASEDATLVTLENLESLVRLVRFGWHRAGSNPWLKNHAIFSEEDVEYRMFFAPQAGRVLKFVGGLTDASEELRGYTVYLDSNGTIDSFQPLASQKVAFRSAVEAMHSSEAEISLRLDLSCFGCSEKDDLLEIEREVDIRAVSVVSGDGAFREWTLNALAFGWVDDDLEINGRIGIDSLLGSGIGVRIKPALVSIIDVRTWTLVNDIVLFFEDFPEMSDAVGFAIDLPVLRRGSAQGLISQDFLQHFLLVDTNDSVPLLLCDLGKMGPFFRALNEYGYDAKVDLIWREDSARRGRSRERWQAAKRDLLHGIAKDLRSSSGNILNISIQESLAENEPDFVNAIQNRAAIELRIHPEPRVDRFSGYVDILRPVRGFGWRAASESMTQRLCGSCRQ